MGATGSGAPAGAVAARGSDVPSADAGEPAALILAALDVEAQADFVAHVEGILVGAVTEEVESDLAGIALFGFKYVFFGFPGVAGFRDTAALADKLDDFTFYFHCYAIFDIVRVGEMETARPEPLH